MDIGDVGRELGRKLCGKVAHVVGTSLRWRDVNGVRKLVCYIDIDSDELKVVADILAEIGGSSWQGHDLFFRIGGTPKFA